MTLDLLAQGLNTERSEPMVDVAMMHLNLVMIHPFRDGNGRVARALQTLVTARGQVLEPTFSSIEEWLGATPRTTTASWYGPAAGPGTLATMPGCG
jgi:Fic family protein